VDSVTFSPRTSGLLAQAEAICVDRGARLTGLRRHVLGLVLDAPKPAGAYDMLDQLRPHHKGAAPPTISRALDFLVEQGLIHKVERLAAFVGCVHGIEQHDHHHHTVQFLICTRCGRVEELNDAKIGKSLEQAATGSGFVIHGSTVEAEGVCGACADHG
jgi:Fur family zinc uptake transcriptional regulator